MSSDQLALLDSQEEKCVLHAFSSEIAWDLGNIIRQEARTKSKPVIISISDAKGVIYFQANSRPGVNLDNQHWVERKRRSVLEFECSTLYLRAKLQAKGRTIEQAFFKPETVYATHGGGFPIRVRGVEGIVGTVVVSGLSQMEDHELIVDSITKYLEDLKLQHKS